MAENNTLNKREVKKIKYTTKKPFPWTSETKIHGKAVTLRGESWLHYLTGQKKGKRGRGIGMP